MPCVATACWQCRSCPEWELQLRVAAPVLPGRPSPAPAQPGPQVRGGRARLLNGAFVRAGPAPAPHLKMLRQQRVLPPGEPTAAWPLGCGSDKGGLSGTEQPWSWALLGAEDTAEQTHARVPALLELGTRAVRWQGRAQGGAGGGLPHGPGAARGSESPRGHCGKTGPQAATGSSGTGQRPPGQLLPLPSSPGAPPCRMRHLQATCPSLSSATNSRAGSGPSGRCLALQGHPPPGGVLRPWRGFPVPWEGAGGGVSDSGRPQTLQLETPGQVGPEQAAPLPPWLSCCLGWRKGMASFSKADRTSRIQETGG